ncbi:hypothetical protein DBIPINDM_003596 [Mesorhizobium sp. AR02]|uniref:hypothetical protein n=1 Tax=Mesorhizobium sp. AR02 TaxID=2865837 RepID=UPI00215DE2E0|nr:hypothetical protein [Mesorhizobium sp. AR02]UVK57265.1 hypothetical protein DBIPINDM_003596 [Mesorhizobium sp. AR02]
MPFAVNSDAARCVVVEVKRHQLFQPLPASDLVLNVSLSVICGRKDSVNLFEGFVAMFWSLAGSAGEPIVSHDMRGRMPKTWVGLDAD